MKFKKGDKVKLVSGSYGITKVGWMGVVNSDGSDADGRVRVAWNTFYNATLPVFAKDLKVIAGRNFTAPNAKNRPEGL